MQQDSFQPLPGSLKYLIGIIVVIELILSINDFGIGPFEQLRWRAVVFAGLWPQLLSGELAPLYSGQPVLMFITHAFVHGSLLHMGMNVVILLAVGKRLALVAGSGWVLGLFIASAVAGGLLFVLINTGDSPAVGASGAVFGFFGFWKALEYRLARKTGASLLPIFQFIGLMTGLNVALWFVLDGYLAWEAHLGGFIAGWFLGMVFRPNPARGRA